MNSKKPPRPARPDGSYWRMRPRAPMPGDLLGPLNDISDPGAKEYSFGAGKTVFSMVVVRQDMAIFGYLNLCPHYAMPLNARAGDFMNDQGTRLRCSMHFAEFRIEDGFGLSGAAENCWLDPVPVVLRDGDIYIDDR